MNIAAERDHMSLRRAGGVSAVAIGIAYLATFALFARVGAPPHDAEAWLRYLTGKTGTWWAILGLSVVSDLLLVPVGLSLYFALKRIGRDLMLVAITLIGLFIALDLAVTWTSYGSLIGLSRGYAMAPSDAQRAAYIAAANYPAAVLASPLEALYSIVLLSLGILLTSVVMLRSGFSRWMAYLGLLTGAAGIASVTGWMVTVIMNAILATIWLFAVGIRLYRLN